jgi:hypothetical protein
MRQLSVGSSSDEGVIKLVELSLEVVVVGYYFGKV